MTLPQSLMIVIESPFNGPDQTAIENNIRFARWCCRAVFKKEQRQAFATHLFCTQFLDDTSILERHQGMDWSYGWMPGVPHWFFIDLGFSKGMIQAAQRCTREFLPSRELSLAEYHPPSFEAFVRGEWPPSTPHGKSI